jgi:hypothetical protein
VFEIEPVVVKVPIKDARPLERIAENEACKIQLDPCYIIIHKEGVFGESQHEFLFFNNKLYKAEGLHYTTCEVCGRLVIGKNNYPCIVSYITNKQVVNLCDSCIEKYRGWDNYREFKDLFMHSCEECAKQSKESLSATKVELHVCEECANHLIDAGFEKTTTFLVNPQSSKPYPILLKGRSKRKQIHRLKLTKDPLPFTDTESPLAKFKNIYDKSEESIEPPRKIQPYFMKQKKEKEKKIQIKEKQYKRTALVLVGIIILLTVIGFGITEYYYSVQEAEIRDAIKREQLLTDSTDELATQTYSSNGLQGTPRKTSPTVIAVRDEYNEVRIFLKEGDWYKLSEAEKLSFANSMLADVHSRKGGPYPVSIYNGGYGRRVAYSVMRGGTDYMVIH